MILKSLTLANSEISRTIVCDSEDQTREEVIGRNSPGAYIRTTVKRQVTLLFLAYAHLVEYMFIL